jgi:4-hydroxy-L-threonine phosphate dehydrogenase PdxA
MLKATSYPTTNKSELTAHKAATLQTHPTTLASPSSPGQLNSSNATYVIETLQLAVDG